MARMPPEATILLLGLGAILAAVVGGISGCYRMLCKALGREPKKGVWGRLPAWAEWCLSILFFVVFAALAYGASTGRGALYDASIVVALLGIAVFVVIFAMGVYESTSGNARRRRDEERERLRERQDAERTALIQAMGQPGYWGNASRTALDSEKPALLASLRAEGFDPGPVMTMASRRARIAVEEELRRHGFKLSHLKRADIDAAARALFAARANKFIAEAKTYRITLTKSSRRKKDR